MALDDLLAQVLKVKASGKKGTLLSDNKQPTRCTTDTKKHKSKKPRELAMYSLGNKYGRVYFTKREAECMVLLLKGKTINGVANNLNLSPRTVEYYVKNMKSKTGCRTKFELIDRVYASDFLQNLGDCENLWVNKT